MKGLNLKFLLVFFILFFISIHHLFAQDTNKEEEALFVAEKAFEDGFYDVSLGLLERFLKNYPNSTRTANVNLLIGQCYFRQNRFLDALNKFQELLDKPQAKDIWDAVIYWIAEVHFKGNNFSKAAQYYKKIITEFPKSSYRLYAYYSLGWCLFQEQRFDEALRYFKIVEENFSKEPLAQDASFKVIECLYSLKDYNALKDKTKFYLKTYPKDTARIPYLYFYLAEADYYLNNFDEAVDGYAKAIRSSQDEKVCSLSKLGMGWAYFKLRQYGLAQNAFSEVKLKDLEKTNQDILLLGKAMLNFETKNFYEAKNIYEELIKETSDPLVAVQAYIGKADSLYNLMEYKQAIETYKGAIFKFSGVIPEELNNKLHYGLAWAYLKEGEFKFAIEEFQKIVKQTEDKIFKISALCQIGDTYQDSGEYDKAIQTYNAILKDYPDSLYSDYVQYQLGLTLLKVNNYDGAIMSFNSLKNNFPQSKLLDEASYALGVTYFQKEDYNSSIEIFQKFQQDFKDSNLRPQAMYLLGTSLYNLGKFNEAIEIFKDIIRVYGQDPELAQKAEYEIADCYYRLGNEKEAMVRFNALRSKYPDSRLTAEVMWWLGEYYYRHNDFNLARRYFSSLIRDFSQSSLVLDAYYALGSICAQESKYDEAINNFKKVLDSGAKTDLVGTAGIAVADIYVKQNQLDLALNIYKDIVNQHPNLAELIYPKIADIYYNIGNYDEAINFYNKSLDVVSVKDMASIQFRIAEAKQAQAKLDEAIEEYLKVTYLYSDDKDLALKALLRAATIYDNKENFKEALNIYKKIAAMNVEEAKYAKERIDWIKTHIK